MAQSTQEQEAVFAALKAVVPPRRLKGRPEPSLRLREDLGVGSLALVSLSMDLCDRFGVDPATLDLAAFVDRAVTVGDVVAIVAELRLRQPS